MSTSSSIAQFMAILSGGTNPGLLRQNSSGASNSGEGAVIDFDALLNQNPDLKNGIVSLLPSSTNDNPVIVTGEQTDEASIWQFIQQQANLDTGNQLVLNLSEKGIPDTIIQDLKSIFGENDLITIIRDPKLNAQLDNAIVSLDSADLQSDNLVGVVDAILQQNKGNIANTLTFSVSEKSILDNVYETLVETGINTTQTTQTADRAAPKVAIAAAASAAAPLFAAANPLTNSASPFAVNPFAAKSDLAATAKGLEKALQSVSAYGSGQASKSLQANIDGVANISATNQSPMSLGGLASFSEFMMSADGEALSSNGDYVIPFEAALKTASQAANPVLSQPQAAQSNPATQMVALSLTKMAHKSADGDQGQRYRLQLDPPEMGRIDIKMDIIDKTNKLQVVITAEKPESRPVATGHEHSFEGNAGCRL